MPAGLRLTKIRTFTIQVLAHELAGRDHLEASVIRALRRDARAGVRALAEAWCARQARARREAARLDGLSGLEDEQRRQGFSIIAGVDEAGVAPLAGPVVAAAVILPQGLRLRGLDDSKRLAPVQREALYDAILRAATAVAVGLATVEEIDRLNVLQAMRLAHRRAILGLPVRPHLVLVDGRYVADAPVPQVAIVDGDATCASIAAASIIAKVSRDRLMGGLAERYPQYGFERHKGYGTRMHRAAIERFGVTPAHRRSFLPVQGRQQMLPTG